MVDFKLGRQKAVKLASVPAFGDFLSKASEWPAVPAMGWEYAVPTEDLEMLGNDKYGDCAEAGAMHLIQSSTYNSGYRLRGTLEQTLDLYSELTGFNPKDPYTDNGTVLTNLLLYWKNQGIKVTDPNGNVVVDKILGWAALDVHSVAQYRYACYLFGGTYLGIECPKNYMDDTTDWVYDPIAPIEGGHCINGVGEGRIGGHIQSWGLNIPAKWDSLLAVMDEAYIVVRENWVSAQDKSPSGLALDDLLAAMKKI